MAEQSSPKNLKTVMLIVVGAVAVFFLLGLLPRILRNMELAKMYEQTAGAVKSVHTVVAQPAPFEETGLLPGSIDAIQYTSIYARVDGYLKRRLVDIGDKVVTGQLLAEIDTPTIDNDVAEAKASLVRAQAGLVSSKSVLQESLAKLTAAKAQVDRAKADEDYSNTTANRWKTMATKGAVSLQSRDEKVRAYLSDVASLSAAQADEKAAEEAVATARSQVNVSKAEVDAKKADLDSLLAKQSFKFVRAPFDGTITLRKVDPGALITSGSQSSNLELFQVAKIEKLRIYVNVPQTFARYLEQGQEAEVLVPEYPEREFSGKISNISDALNPSTRTRQTEVRIDNRDQALLPGMYAQVRLKVERKEPWIRVPGTALVPLNNGMFVVVVEGNKAHYQKVVIGRDFGDEIEIKAGLKPNAVVVLSPPVDLQEGEAVAPISDKQDSGK
ncbi:MAG: efflux RND transporter periplasmic adaptor subunit [Candidatus Obscuribacterales bacterium]|nr:efflux RND transporter periplasmic adaptor subunit [Candidatus Obscuribacterales bacterium]